jgi:uroporphyrinogen-III synthase
MRILITRPEPSASRTASMLEALDLTAEAHPLTKITTLELPLVSSEAPYCVMATSKNAFLHGRDVLTPLVQGASRFICVGEGTARAGLDVGLPDALIVAPDAETLFRRLKASGIDRALRRIVYLAGKRRLTTLERAFDETHINLELVEAYDAAEVAAPFSHVEDFRFDAVFLLSARAARLFAKHWEHPHVPVPICISTEVAASLPGDQRERAFVSEDKTLNSMVKSAQTLNAD